MIIVNKGPFFKGMLLMCSFIVVFISIFLPIITLEDGTKENPLNYADNFFNSLSKGSAYFIPDVRSRADKDLLNKNVDIVLHLSDAKAASELLPLVQAAGLQASAEDKNLSIKGDVLKLVNTALADAEAMYNNDGESVSKRWNGADAKSILRGWHRMMSASIKPMQRAGMIVEAQVIDMVARRAVEPSYNFFGINASKVSDNVVMLSFLLVFYVVYTMWYGFAIFDLFEGFGLTMKKAAVKEEV